MNQPLTIEAVAPISAPKIILPLAHVKLVDQGTHFLKIKVVHFGQEQLHWLPLSLLDNPTRLQAYLADQVGYREPDTNSLIRQWQDLLPSLPYILGTSRLGWPADRKAFVYNGTVYPLNHRDPLQYEFVAPEGTIIKQASQAFTPKGDRGIQFQAFQALWKASWEFRLALSLATVSPLLEPLNVPPLLFHVAGLSGWGKTTLFRLALSAFADPDSPLIKIDASKDTQNYADAQLGILRNFPMLLDETTLGDPGQMAKTMYNLAMGRTKGRLGGSETLYLPTEPMKYNLVVFLSGEAPLRNHLEHSGAAARLVEVVLEKEIFTKGELPKWWDLAQTHYGWYGHAFIQRVIQQYFSDGQEGKQLKALYEECREGISGWCQHHSRSLDFLAALQLGHYLSSQLLFHECEDTASHGQLLQDGEKFVRTITEKLHTRTMLDQVVECIQEVSGIGPYVERGFIPTAHLEDVEKGCDLDRSQLGKFLIAQGLVSKIEPRKVAGGISQRCYILTPAGKEKLCSFTTP